MTLNILITGAAGYIGGSIVEQFLRTDGLIQGLVLFAAVRTKEQVGKLSKLPITAFPLDVNDEKAVLDAVLEHKIDVLINTVASFVPNSVLNMAKALGERKKITGQPVYLIHSGVTTVFSAEAGWPYGEIKDSGDIYEKEKQWKSDHPVRETDLALVDGSEAHGVTSMNVIIPVVYGKGSGEGRKISVSLPAYVRASIADRVVHKFDTDAAMPHVHISDLIPIYTLLVKKILAKEPIPSGKQGCYLAIAHRAPQWKVMEAIASSLYRRGMVSDPEPRIWPDDATAAERLEFPVLYARAMGTTSGQQVPENAARLGWKPQWDTERSLANVDNGVGEIIELDTVRPRLFEPLIKN